MKLGKNKPVEDARNLKLRAILRAEPALPAEYDFDDQFGGSLPTPMHQNDIYGNCVIVGRAHHTRRLELVDQGGMIGIDDDDVNYEYFRETGGRDSGLFMLPSLKSWRNEGWTLGWTTYKIKAFAEIMRINPLSLGSPWDQHAIKAAIYGTCGVHVGLGLPITAETQFNNGKPWDLESFGGDGAQYSWGGHLVYCPGYNSIGPVCITWGQRQQMTWRFLDYYGDEIYSVIDDESPNYRGHLIDKEAVDSFLETIK